MVTTLPYDIWFLVAKYIPKATLLQLYSVNTAFFDLVMNEQYQEVVIDYSKDEFMQRRLSFMGPVVLKRVQTLIICPDSDLKSSDLKSSKRKIRKVEKLKNYLNLPWKENNNGSLVQGSIEQMIQMTTLNIGSYFNSNLDTFKSITPFVQTAWLAHGSRLTSLTLSIPLEAFPIIQLLPALDALARLIVRLQLAYPTTIYEETLLSIARFIGVHAASLTSLSIDIASAIIDPFYLFSNIPTLPRLQNLSLTIWLERLRPQYHTGIDQFLQKHATSITEYKIRFWGPNTFDTPPAPDVFFSNAIFHVDLPSLRTLDLGLCSWSEEQNETAKDHLVQYLRRMQNSLTELSIGGYILTYKQVEGIVGVFSGEKSLLQSLEMHMYFLSCNLLDLLYQQLPKLTSFGLRFDALLRQDDGSWSPNYYWHGYDTRAADFAEEMAKRQYSNWSLRHLTVEPLYCGSGRWNKCRAMLAAALPAVISFNGVSEEEFIEFPPDSAQLRNL